MDNNCEMEEIYKQRVENFFKYTDRNNSKRVQFQTQGNVLPANGLEIQSDRIR